MLLILASHTDTVCIRLCFLPTFSFVKNVKRHPILQKHRAYSNLILAIQDEGPSLITAWFEIVETDFLFDVNQVRISLH